MNLHYPNSRAVIDFSILKKNIKALKQLAGPDKKIMAVIKADAYSHGAIETALTIENIIDWFAVATADEGIELREAGIIKPVLIFGVPASETGEVFLRNQLTATVSHNTHFSLLSDGTQFHINFDTGMGRLGFKPEECHEVRVMINDHPHLECTGIYSHYATADDPGSVFVMQQSERFKIISDQFPEIENKHISNTGAAVHYKYEHYDMIRIGLGLWGYTPGIIQSDVLKPVMNWKTFLAEVRPVKKGEAISYGATWKCPHDGYIGTIPVGYADGIPRSLSNKLEVYINGIHYPVAGNVTMDYTMIWLGGRNLEIGTEVELMGGNAWPANKWAETAGTNTHEILTNITPRVKKTYLET
ncbi:MAG: alanine racemase [Balneolaceae bacterium]